MKQLQEIENNTKAARQRLRRFLIEVQCNLSSHLDGCKCGGCRNSCSKCNESHRICDEAQKMLNDD